MCRALSPGRGSELICPTLSLCHPPFSVAETWMSRAPQSARAPQPRPSRDPPSSDSGTTSPPTHSSSHSSSHTSFMHGAAPRRSPARATYLSHTYIYGDAAHELRDLHERPAMETEGQEREGRHGSEARRRRILPVPVPDTPERSWLMRSLFQFSALNPHPTPGTCTL